MTAHLRRHLGTDMSWLNRFRVRNNNQGRRRYFAAKRGIDIVVAGTMLVLLAPLLALIVALIKLESPKSPVMYLSERTGRNGRRFRMYKFRSMSTDADTRLDEIKHLNVKVGGDVWIPNDPRVTRVGRFIRRTKLDELPQLFNVLLGNMAIVGPRPTSSRVDRLRGWHTERFDSPPGITGLWQLFQDRVVHFDDKIRLDIAYLERQCIALDAFIAWQTLTLMVRPRPPVDSLEVVESETVPLPKVKEGAPAYGSRDSVLKRRRPERPLAS